MDDVIHLGWSDAANLSSSTVAGVSRTGVYEWLTQTGCRLVRRRRGRLRLRLRGGRTACLWTGGRHVCSQRRVSGRASVSSPLAASVRAADAECVPADGGIQGCLSTVHGSSKYSLGRVELRSD